jgi:hypothetical protein
MAEEQLARLFLLAQKLAERTPGFFEIKGAGAGDKATNEFMAVLRRLAKDSLGNDHAERKAYPGTNLRFDFYLPNEETVVEVALGLRNPQSEIERDIFKCLLAREAGLKIGRLVFFSKPGAIAKQNEPAQKAILDLARRKFDLEIEILEFEPRATSPTSADAPG